MSHRLLPLPQLTLPEGIVTYLRKLDPMISETVLLITEVRHTNKLLQQLLTQQLASQKPTQRRVQRS